MINVKENRRSNQEYTIQTERQTQDTARRQTKHKHNTENYKVEQHGPHQKRGMNTDACEL